MAAALRLVGIAQDRVDVAALAEDVDRNHTRLARRLDAVIHGVLQQWLQHQRRHQRVAGHAVEMPLDLQALAQAQLERQVLPAQPDLVGERASSPLSRINTRKRSARSCSATSAWRGSVRTSDSTALRLLNRKCGRCAPAVPAVALR
jgi:hypothetical protein